MASCRTQVASEKSSGAAGPCRTGMTSSPPFNTMAWSRARAAARARDVRSVRGRLPNMAEEGDCAAGMNGYPKYVASTSLEPAEWNNSHIFYFNLPAEVAILTLQSGRAPLHHTAGA